MALSTTMIISNSPLATPLPTSTVVKLETFSLKNGGVIRIRGVTASMAPRNRKPAICSVSGDGSSSVQTDVPFPTDYSELLEQVLGLIGMPCRHTCSVIFFKGDDPEDYCSHYYTAQSYKACYEPVVNPINGENMWPTLNQQMLPPTYRAKPGRPKRLRRREPDEPVHPHKYRRSSGSLRCGTCNMYGHNARHCTRNEVSQPAAAADPPTVDPVATQTTRGRGRGRGRAWRGRGGRGRQATPETPIRVRAPRSQPETPTSTVGRGRERRGREATTAAPETPIRVRAPRSQPGTPTSPAGRGRGWRGRRATTAVDPDPIGQLQILSQPTPSIATGSRSPIQLPSDPELYSLPGFKLRAMSLGSFGTLFYKE